MGNQIIKAKKVADRIANGGYIFLDDTNGINHLVNKRLTEMKKLINNYLLKQKEQGKL